MIVGRTLNGQPLLEFPLSNNGAVFEPVKVKKAILWSKVERKYSYHYQHHQQRQRVHKNITLWVFRVKCGNMTHLRGEVCVKEKINIFLYKYLFVFYLYWDIIFFFQGIE